MGKLVYQKGDLFHQIGHNRILVHACNARGTWGSGISKGFRKSFPLAHAEYQKMCKSYGKDLVGRASIIPGIQSPVFNCWVGCLFTSAGYGFGRDSEELILKNTERAITELLKGCPEQMEINSPKFNAGLFGVPWEKTEDILQKCLKKSGHNWIIWSK